MTLRPGKRPALLLLDLWEKQGQGQRAVPVDPCLARARLLELGYVWESVTLCWLILTPAGQAAAQSLAASS